MTPEYFIALIGAAIVGLTLAVVLIRFGLRRAKLKPRKKKFDPKWKDLQKSLKDKSKWPEALQSADKLLDKALIKRGYKGQSMGERLVNAQRDFTNNDAVWFGHKLAKKNQEDPEAKLSEKDIKDALIGIRQGLRDLGAL